MKRLGASSSLPQGRTQQTRFLFNLLRGGWKSEHAFSTAVSQLLELEGRSGAALVLETLCTTPNPGFMMSFLSGQTYLAVAEEAFSLGGETTYPVLREQVARNLGSRSQHYERPMPFPYSDPALAVRILSRLHQYSGNMSQSVLIRYFNYAFGYDSLHRNFRDTNRGAYIAQSIDQGREFLEALWSTIPQLLVDYVCGLADGYAKQKPGEYFYKEKLGTFVAGLLSLPLETSASILSAIRERSESAFDSTIRVGIQDYWRIANYGVHSPGELIRYIFNHFDQDLAVQALLSRFADCDIVRDAYMALWGPVGAPTGSQMNQAEQRNTLEFTSLCWKEIGGNFHARTAMDYACRFEELLGSDLALKERFFTALNKSDKNALIVLSGLMIWENIEMIRRLDWQVVPDHWVSSNVWRLRMDTNHQIWDRAAVVQRFAARSDWTALEKYLFFAVWSKVAKHEGMDFVVGIFEKAAANCPNHAEAIMAMTWEVEHFISVTRKEFAQSGWGMTLLDPQA